MEKPRAARAAKTRNQQISFEAEMPLPRPLQAATSARMATQARNKNDKRRREIPTVSGAGGPERRPLKRNGADVPQGGGRTPASYKLDGPGIEVG